MRTPRATILAVAALALALATPARAQYEPPRFRAGGGPILPAGATSDHFETGWQLMGGVGWKLARHEAFVFRFDYGYSRERLVGRALDAGFVNGQHQVHDLEADVEWTLTRGPAPVYLLAGPGVYLQRTEITNLSDYAPGPPICDPWLQVCAPGPVPAEDILGSRSSTNFGFNLGAGVDIPIRGRVAAFVEIRWRFVWGDVYGLPGGSERRGHFNYFPVTLGVRF